MNLEEIRKDIDEIDRKMVDLLCKRMDCSLRVAESKRREGLPVYRPEREREILRRVGEQGGAYGSYITEIYRLLMECSRELQHEALADNDAIRATVDGADSALRLTGTVACYGEEGSFTQIAFASAFGDDQPAPIFAETFEQVFEAVDSGRAQFGFVPVENSSAGSVNEVYDLILKYKLFIVGSVSMPIVQNLLAVKGASLSDIRLVYSHPQALSQCQAFLQKQGIEPREYANTAAAAKLVAGMNDRTVGAVGSVDIAKKSGLDILCPSIQSFDNNKTRFIVLSKRPVITAGSDKISVVFSLSHTPGSLQRILTRFSLHGLNLTKLESRAGKNGDFETQFYLDFLGNVKHEKTLSLLSALKAELTDFTFLGNYKEILL